MQLARESRRWGGRQPQKGLLFAKPPRHLCRQGLWAQEQQSPVGGEECQLRASSHFVPGIELGSSEALSELGKGGPFFYHFPVNNLAARFWTGCSSEGPRGAMMYVVFFLYRLSARLFPQCQYPALVFRWRS